MEKVVYVIYYKSGEVLQTELVDEARHAFEDDGAEVHEVRRRDEFIGRVHIETVITYRW